MREAFLAWQQAQSALKEKLGQTTFDTWIMPLKPRSKSQDMVILEAPDSFFKDWVEKNYGQAILEAFGANPGIKVTIEVGEHGGGPQKKSELSLSSAKVLNVAATLNLNHRYTFDNFVIGPSNRHAHAYSLAVAESPAKTYNPLFIYGGVGLGKSHLIQAICHHVLKNASNNLKVCYLPSDAFTNELIEAIQRRTTANFRQKYRNVDLLVMDDVHFIAGKESTQEEFFHTFNSLYDNHKQIVLSSDRPPKEISDLQERLVSRFSWGLTTDIQPPDLETRVAILKKKIERENVVVPDEVIFFIAQLIKTNIRELEGALVRTIACSLLEERPVELALAKEVLKDLLREPKKLITVDFIQRCVAEDFGVSLLDLKTKRRNKTIVFPRQVAMYLSRDLTELSLPEIGGFFGGKDHTTVLHSYNKIKKYCEDNDDLRERINRLIKVIKQ